jgi:hypothetical protein
MALRFDWGGSCAANERQERLRYRHVDLLGKLLSERQPVLLPLDMAAA